MLSLALVAIGCGRPADPPRRSAVVIAADTLRRDRMSAFGAGRSTTPRFDARGALRQELAFSTSNWTLPATASMLTGALPERTGVTLAANAPGESTVPLLVASAVPVLRERGLRTALFSGNPGLDRVIGIEEGFDEFALLSDLPTGNSAEVVDAALAWLDAGDAPFFLWLQPFDTHFPYLPPAEVAGAFRDPRTLPFDLTYEAELAAVESDYAGLDAAGRASVRQALLDLYDEELLYLDTQIDRLLEELDARGLLDDTLVVWTADHGELFDDGGTTFFFHGVSLRPGVNRVPLLVLEPDPPRWTTDGLFSGVDVLPSVFAALDLAPPAFADGVPFGAGRTRAYAWDPVGAGWDEAVPPEAALTDGRWKVLAPCGAGAAIGFDLAADPDELAGFEPGAHPETAQLAAELTGMVAGLHPTDCPLALP
jgi:arylsulfatase